MDEIESKIKEEFNRFFEKTEAFKTVTQGKDVRNLCFEAYRAAALPLYVKVQDLEEYKHLYEISMKGF